MSWGRRSGKKQGGEGRGQRAEGRELGAGGRVLETLTPDATEYRISKRSGDHALRD